MLFNTLNYALFLPLVVLAYYVLPTRFRLLVLLAGSYFFYASWNILFLPLIIGLSGANFLLGLWLGNSLQVEAKRSARIILILGIVLNLGTLGFFKYTLFSLNSAVSLFKFFGIQINSPGFSIILPLGISFFVFEFIHYLVDVGRGVPPIRNFLRFAVFAAFFPTQIAGPIKRFESFVPQLDNSAKFNWEQSGEGLSLILRGLFKKAVLADNLAPLVAVGFGYPGNGPFALTSLDAWLTTLAFAMQIYFDFSGYTDIGRGSALILGYQVPENFHFPYLSTSPREFWRRWHISLSTWLRDYVYIPLGGNKRGVYRNIIITMVLGGLWHGASWTFVIWGAYHGFLQVFNRLLAGKIKATGRVAKLGGWLLTFVLVCVGWVFFRAQTLSGALYLLAAMSGLRAGNAEIFFGIERLLIIGIVVGCLVTEWVLVYWKEVESNYSNNLQPILEFLRPSLYSLLLTMVILFHPEKSGQFIYFQF